MKDNEKRLLQAAKNGNFTECERLIQQGVNVNAKDDEHEIGWSPLLLAARSGHLDLVRLLLQQGADVNAKSKSEQTPLHGASWNGHANVAKLLLDHGADPNARNKFGQTPLHWAAHYGHGHVCQVLVSHGALVNARNEDGETPLDKAQSSAVKSVGRSAVIQLLQRSQTKLNFLAILFAKKDEFNFHEWHERLISVMEDMHDMRLYYTALRMSLARRMILKRQACVLLERALERSSALAGNSEQAFSLWRTLLAKCLHDELIDEHVYNTFDGYDRSPRFGTNIAAPVELPFASLRSAVHKRSAQINGLEGSTRAVQRTLQVLVRKMQTLRNEEILSSPSKQQQVMGNATTTTTTTNPSTKSKRFKVKLDALVSMLGSIVNAFALSTCTPAHEKIFSRMVDFGDVQHMRHALQACTDIKYPQAFDDGVALAAQVHKTPALSGPLAKQLDDAIKRKEPLVIVGFVAGLADPSACSPSSSSSSSSSPLQAHTTTKTEAPTPSYLPPVKVVSGQPGMLPHEKRYFNSSVDKQPSDVTKSSPSPSLTSSSYLTSTKGGSNPASTSSFSLPTKPSISKESPTITKKKLALGDPPTKEYASGTIPSIVPKHLPPIKHVEMPVNPSSDAKSVATTSYQGSSMDGDYESSSDFMVVPTGSMPKQSLTRIYKDAILVEADEIKLDLHAAVKYGDKELLQEALRLANQDACIVNAKDSNGRTALDLAALTGQMEMITELRDHGAQYAFKSGARMRAIARRRSEFVTTYLQLVENELE